MGLLAVVSEVVAGVVGMLVLASVVLIGPDRLRASSDEVRSNVRETAPYLCLLAVALLANGVLRDVGADLSWVIGINITENIYAVEGQFVAHVQSLANPALTAYFGFVYVFGYAFLLTFPLVAYLVHENDRFLRQVVVAYVVNYGVGLLCYVAFIAYGPRNFMPELVESLLYTSWPQSQLLTSEINVNTNVFPSLHTSLSVTAAVLARRSRDAYPRWYPVAAVLAASITVSTMYLGIHWATDVVAGTAVGLLSTAVAARVVADPDRDGNSDRPASANRWTAELRRLLRNR
jgi:membrane-associated phospholipid phosphatase